MPFTHKVLAYCEATEELKDSNQREANAAKAVELAKEFADSLPCENGCTWRAIVHVDVVTAE